MALNDTGGDTSQEDGQQPTIAAIVEGRQSLPRLPRSLNSTQMPSSLWTNWNICAIMNVLQWFAVARVQPTAATHEQIAVY